MYIKIVLVGKIKEKAYNDKIQKYLGWLSKESKFVFAYQSMVGI